ncbi:putative divalent cation/proton antiporter TMEM165 [Littorina saxatilis]|uniref:GDT1 family protein n=1 Tax=Littorina saxatilis TaxID=31220 RepID=A0AAN9B0S3_9CAEN
MFRHISAGISRRLSFFIRTLLLCLLLSHLVNLSVASDLDKVFQIKSNRNSDAFLLANPVASRQLLDHERDDNHKEDGNDEASKVKQEKDNGDSKLKEDAEDTVEDVDDFLHKIQKNKKGNLGFMHALVASLSVIIVSEIGDKTFFIAAILAMRHSRVTVLMGALSALIFMTIMSALVGYATTVIPRAYTYYASSILFAIFGLKMLKEAWVMSPDEGQEEYDEAQAEIKKKEDELLRQNTPVQDMESGIIRTPGRRFWSGILSTVFLESFTLTFLGEWGDRSQIATIILGAREDVLGVIIGCLVGHTLCTGLAVVGGRFVAQKISIRTVTFIGAIVFLIFAASALFIGPDS